MGRILSIYIDGALDQTKVLDWQPRRSRDSWILNRWSDFDYNGFSLYSWVLSSKEILQLALNPQEKTLFTHPLLINRNLYFKKEDILPVGLKGGYTISFLASFQNRTPKQGLGTLSINHAETKITLNGMWRTLSDTEYRLDNGKDFIPSPPLPPPSPADGYPDFRYLDLFSGNFRPWCDNSRNIHLCKKLNQCFDHNQQLINGRYEDGCPVYDNLEDDPYLLGCKGQSICVTMKSNNHPISIKGTGYVASFPRWTHVAITFLGQDISVYFDGVLMTTYTARNNLI